MVFQRKEVSQGGPEGVTVVVRLGTHSYAIVKMEFFKLLAYASIFSCIKEFQPIAEAFSRSRS